MNFKYFFEAVVRGKIKNLNDPLGGSEYKNISGILNGLKTRPTKNF